MIILSMSMSTLLLVAAFLGERITDFTIKWGENREATANLAKVGEAADDLSEAEEALADNSKLTEPAERDEANARALDLLRQASNNLREVYQSDMVRTVSAPDSYVTDDVTWISIAQSVNTGFANCVLFYRTEPIPYTVEAVLTRTDVTIPPQVKRTHSVKRIDEGYRATADTRPSIISLPMASTASSGGFGDRPRHRWCSSRITFRRKRWAHNASYIPR